MLLLFFYFVSNQHNEKILFYFLLEVCNSFSILFESQTCERQPYFYSWVEKKSLIFTIILLCNMERV